LSDFNGIEALGGWEGHQVHGVWRCEADAEHAWARVFIELRPVAQSRPICAGCGQPGPVHQTEVRWVRDLPCWGALTVLKLHRRRVRCPACGPRLERLGWLAPHARVTTRLAESVARLCQMLPVAHVARWFALGWDAVKDIDKAHLERRLGPPDLDGLSVLAMDEFAIHSGHRYATVVADPRTRRVIWVGRGRSREAIRPFFELLGPARCARIEAVAMDMNGAYELEVRAHCPRAQVVFDLFHVVAKYGREVIDRVRVDEANRLRHDKPARRVIKGARWLLLRNRENLKRPEERVRLDELLEANRALALVHVLREDLKQLWTYRSRPAAARCWRDWLHRARDSGLAPLIRFAQRLQPYLHGILAHCQWPLHTSVLEGINNKIKVIKRMAYGFRDDHYFFLKIRAAFPGLPG